MNWQDIIILALVAGTTTGILIPLLKKLCFRFGFLDLPGEHKRHSFPTPNLGGLAMFIGFWATILFAYHIYQPLASEIGRFLYFVLAGGTLILLIGLIDDISALSAVYKLMAQVVVGLILYQGGLQITYLFIPLYGPVKLGILSLPFTLLWLVGVTNSINLIDGLDGLAAGVSAIAALVFLLIGIQFSLVTVIVFAAAIIGICLVFLYFNHYPAQIFMGDSGSLFLGYLFAVLSIIFPIKSYVTAAVFVPLVALGVPIMETLVSFSRRVIAGQRFYKADNRHLFHYLEASGLSKAQVVWLFYLFSAVFAVFSGAMFLFEKRLVFTILVIFMVVIFIVLFRFRLAYIRKNKESERYG